MLMRVRLQAPDSARTEYRVPGITEFLHDPTFSRRTIPSGCHSPPTGRLPSTDRISFRAIWRGLPVTTAVFALQEYL